MGWQGWVKNDNNSESNTKVERNSDGSTTTHYLNTTNGSRQNARVSAYFTAALPP
jgi:hypothetical protein